MELKIEEQQQLEPIKWNFKELQTELGRNLAKYEGKVVTEESLVEAKQDRANLNKLSKAINDKKIDIKKKYLEPYTAFENEVKQLLGMIEKPSLAIDLQVKKFEEVQKEDKLNQIKDLFGKINDNPHITFKMVYNEKWLNVAYKPPKIKEEMGESILKIEKDLNAIETFKTEFEVELINKYLDTLDLSVVMQEKARLENIKAIQEQKKAEAAPVQAPAPIVQQAIPVVQQAPAPAIEAEEVMELDFRVWITESQKQRLKAFLVQEGIKVGRVQ